MSEIEPQPEENKEQLRKDKLGEIFDSHNIGSKRMKSLLFRLKPFLDSEEIDGEEIKVQLEALADIEDRDEFIEKTFSILRPVYELETKNLAELQTIIDKNHLEIQRNSVEVNEVFNYDIEGEIANIHLSPAKGFPIKELKKLYLEGLITLAKVIEKNEYIATIKAHSWIVSENPKLIERLGFTLTDDYQKSYNAIISKEDFLKRYLHQ